MRITAAGCESAAPFPATATSRREESSPAVRRPSRRGIVIMSQIREWQADEVEQRRRYTVALDRLPTPRRRAADPPEHEINQVAVLPAHRCTTCHQPYTPETDR